MYSDQIHAGLPLVQPLDRTPLRTGKQVAVRPVIRGVRVGALPRLALSEGPCRLEERSLDLAQRFLLKHDQGNAVVELGTSSIKPSARHFAVRPGGNHPGDLERKSEHVGALRFAAFGPL